MTHGMEDYLEDFAAETPYNRETCCFCGAEISADRLLCRDCMSRKYRLNEPINPVRRENDSKNNHTGGQDKRNIPF